MSDDKEEELIRSEDLMWPGEVAAMFKVDPKTVTRWGKKGRLHTYKTRSGRHLFYRPEVEYYLRKIEYR